MQDIIIVRYVDFAQTNMAKPYKNGAKNIIRVPLIIRVKSNADRIFKSNENDRRHSRKAMSREFEAAILCARFTPGGFHP